MADYRTVRQYDIFDCFNSDGSPRQQDRQEAQICSDCRYNIKGVCYFEPDREKRRHLTDCRYHSDKLGEKKGKR